MEHYFRLILLSTLIHNFSYRLLEWNRSRPFTGFRINRLQISNFKRMLVHREDVVAVFCKQLTNNSRLKFKLYVSKYFGLEYKMCVKCTLAFKIVKIKIIIIKIV